MGAIKGAVSFTRFYVWGQPPADFRTTYTQSIERSTFQGLDPKDDDEEKIGWCVMDEPFDLDLTGDKFFFNLYINLGVRLDRWRIPGPTLKAHLATAEAEFRVKQKQERLGRETKLEIRKVVTQKIRERILPTMKTVDMSWDLNTGIVRLWSQSQAFHEKFQDLFKKTFDLALVPENPYTTTLRIGLTQVQAEQFEKIEPDVYHLMTPQQTTGV